MKHITQKIKEKGISLLFVVLISGVILAIGLGLSAILVQQIRMMGEVGYSTVAFYAADSGVEEALYRLYTASTSPAFSYSWDGGVSSYDVSIKCCSSDPECPTEFICPAEFETDESCPTCNYRLKSIGNYRNVKRAIQTEY